MNYLIIAAIGYILGSIPTAYILLKKIYSKDITILGSGNVGAMNIYDITSSKFLGILVFIIDAFKGLFSVYIALIFFPISFIYPAVALIFALLGHNFNPWLQFKGGRGLSTAFGGSLILTPYLPVIWILFWILGFAIKRDIIIVNIFATIFTFITVILAIENIFSFHFLLNADSIDTLLLYIISLLLIIFVRLLEPFYNLKNTNED